MNFGMDYQGDGGNGGMTSSQGGGYQAGSPSTGGGGGGGKVRKSYDEQTLIPVTARMVLSATSNSNTMDGGTGSLLLADGRELYQIKLVGAVRSFEVQSTNVNFEIEDGTGLVEVKMWVDDNTDCSAVQQLRDQVCKDHTYVKIVGQVKDYGGKLHVVAYSVRPLSSANEITHHLLEVVHSGETSKRAGAIVAPSLATTSGGVGFGGGGGGGTVPMGGGGGMPVAVSSSSGGGNGNGGIQEAVASYIQTEGEHLEVGASVADCIKSLSGQYTESQVRQAIDNLASEGLIYSTINEDNYKYAQ
eukprot:CAMPEP_0195293376 /NCGR_PEP_ID=MMETSP0707-20130614/12294_1 /TAXON_ID=33640 /ORGANISM="Asterionellopsis glacialis, Strain CCMP134" /LENGTH=301 /DNA_ID=CAMNT_0040354071 /DNA_START=45 /DNA_END=950 /DNA_ORIENTATION=-